ncbi:MAG: transcriptional regulator NrdR [Dethiobacteria bacterium]
MKCPFCGELESRVADSRMIEEGTAIKRRRECTACEKRFNTMEKVEENPIMVIKRDGRREVFDGNKILTGLLRASEKRNVPLGVLQGLVEELEQELRVTYTHEVDADQIGDILLNKLRKIDEVTYVRFASVFHQFQDIDTFKKELEKMIKMRETD